MTFSRCAVPVQLGENHSGIPEVDKRAARAPQPAAGIFALWITFSERGAFTQAAVLRVNDAHDAFADAPQLA